jgi:hypothetical protein
MEEKDTVNFCKRFEVVNCSGAEVLVFWNVSVGKCE